MEFNISCWPIIIIGTHTAKGSELPIWGLAFERLFQKPPNTCHTTSDNICCTTTSITLKDRRAAARKASVVQFVFKLLSNTNSTLKDTILLVYCIAADSIYRLNSN